MQSQNGAKDDSQFPHNTNLRWINPSWWGYQLKESYPMLLTTKRTTPSSGA